MILHCVFLRLKAAITPAEKQSLFDAVVQCVEESVMNALVCAETMVGRDGNKTSALPHDQVRAILKKHGRLVETKK